jgi:hypothetical protein
MKMGVKHGQKPWLIHVVFCPWHPIISKTDRGLLRHLFPGSHLLRWFCLGLLIWFLSAGATFAGESSLEFWPEIDAWLKLTPAWRLSLFVPISKNIETHYREGNLILQGDYSFWKMNPKHHKRMLDENRAQQMRRLMVRVGYLGGKSLGDNGEAYSEHTMLTEFHVRTPIKGGILISHRLRTDLRWLGEDHTFSQRLRYRLMVEREWTAGRWSFVPYANAEPYYDSRYDVVNRTRWIGGASVAWSPRFAIETNWTYQHDTRSSVTNLNALNVILHLFFETKHAKQAH